jgi:uncharacterized phage infection (PIP) family protein YhgE
MKYFFLTCSLFALFNAFKGLRYLITKEIENNFELLLFVIFYNLIIGLFLFIMTIILFLREKKLITK